MSGAAMRKPIRQCLCWAQLLAVAAVVAVVPRVGFAQDVDEDVLRIVRSQLASEVSLWAEAAPGTPAIPVVTAEHLVGYPEPLRVWRVVPSLPHAHPYLLAKTEGAVLRLGGFPAPDLWGLAAVLAQPIAGNAAAVSRAKLLATLADEFGALRYIFVGDSPGEGRLREALAQWRRRKPRDWPSNVVVSTGDGTWRVTLTLLTQNTRSFNQEWLAHAYSFELDDRGSLISWSERRGTAFNAE